jgi:hypothetical protein
MMPFYGNRNHPLRPKAAPPADPDFIEFGEVEPELLRYHATTETIDNVAVAVARLPHELTRPQKQRLRIIARELVRRARAK